MRALFYFLCDRSRVLGKYALFGVLFLVGAAIVGFITSFGLILLGELIVGLTGISVEPQALGAVIFLISIALTILLVMLIKDWKSAWRSARAKALKARKP